MTFKKEKSIRDSQYLGTVFQCPMMMTGKWSGIFQACSPEGDDNVAVQFFLAPHFQGQI